MSIAHRRTGFPPTRCKARWSRIAKRGERLSPTAGGVVTFFVAFALAVLPEIDELNANDVGTGAIYGVIFVGLRAGVKAVLELVVAKLGGYKK